MDRSGKTFDSLGALLREALGPRLAAEDDNFARGLADDDVMEFLYVPPGTARVEGG